MKWLLPEPKLPWMKWPSSPPLSSTCFICASTWGRASRTAKGGNITVTGRTIALTGAKLNASGKTGGVADSRVAAFRYWKAR